VTKLACEGATEGREPGTAGAPDALPAAAQPGAVGGVELSRLVSLARLSPAQALEIGAGLLAGAVRRSEAGGEPGTVGRVEIGAEGEVVLAAAGPKGSTVAAVLADVADAARSGARPADPVAEVLVAELDRAVVDLAQTGLAAVAATLGAAADALDRRVLRTELAALVRAIGNGGGSPGTAGGTGAADRSAAAGRAERGTSGSSGSAARRAAAWVLSLVVLSALVVLELVLLQDDLRTDIDQLLQAGRSGSESSATASATPSPAVPTVVAPAPPSAAGVTAVDLRPLAPCAPGAPCTVRVLVRLVPGAVDQVVTWSYRVIDPCTRASGTVAGGSVTVPAQGRLAAAVGTVALPAQSAVAVVAVTDAPAIAASPPVVVGSCGPDSTAG
jgi:hypothetical protein